MGDRLNPELILAAAKIARPQYNWLMREDRIEYDEYEEGMLACSVGFFVEYADEAHALMLALMKAGNGLWSFGSNHEDIYVAWRVGDHLMDESFPLLLLKACAAQTGIEMYV
jgi:hypothetical protein